MSEVLLDTRYRVETPEGIDLEAQLAGPVPRILAYAIDLSVRTVALMIAAGVLGALGEVGNGIMLVLAFLLEWFYPVVFEVLNRGQTPGKQVIGIMAVNDDLTPVNWNTSLLRNVLRAADFLPLFYLGGLLSMVIDARFRRLGDLTAGTLVIHRERRGEELSLPPVPPRAPAIALDLDDQIAVIAFTQRHQQLSDSRQRELAGLLEPLTGTSGADAVQYLHSVGGWLLGDRR